MNNPASMLELRCKFCSAPLSAKQFEEIIRCEYCGSSQKLIDARSFVDQILLQVNAWVRQSMPAGLGENMTSMMDPVARHMVFINSIKPRLTTEYGEYKFNCFNLLSYPLITLPFMVTNAGVKNNPKQIFLFQAKVQSIQQLAVDTDGKDFISEINAMSVAYGYLLNNIMLSSDNKPERYHFMTQNFDAASQATKSLRRFPGLSNRLEGLGKLSNGLDLLMSQQPNKATASLQEAKNLLEKSEQTFNQNPETAILNMAAKIELSIANSAIFLTEYASQDASGKISGDFSPIANLLSIISTIQKTQSSIWKTPFLDAMHNEKIFGNIAAICRAKNGSGTINAIFGNGSHLLPFWVVDIPYTFQTGALWKTKGVEVVESVLISATFPADSNALNGAELRHVLTDVFGARLIGGFMDSAMKRMSGKETSISGGDPVRQVIYLSRPGNPRGIKVIPPLSTMDDAVIIAKEYIKMACRLDSGIGNKLRLSSPRAVDLIYIQGFPEQVGGNIVPLLGGLSPRSVGNPNAILGIAI
jgi:DNA-directed RNA polymerase subunit RPC12/RpoP